MWLMKTLMREMIVWQLEYNFYPRTWVLPNDFADFRSQFDANGKSKSVFIVKPDGGCQGRGIFLTQNIEDITPADSVVAQQYITRPLLDRKSTRLNSSH